MLENTFKVLEDGIVAISERTANGPHTVRP